MKKKAFIITKGAALRLLIGNICFLAGRQPVNTRLVIRYDYENIYSCYLQKLLICILNLEYYSFTESIEFST